MSKVFVKFIADYADEFNVYGFSILKKEDWEAHMGKAKKIFDYLEENYQRKLKEAKDKHIAQYGLEKPYYGYTRRDGLTVGFGTNEAIEYCSFEDYQNSFTVSEIKPSQIGTLNKFFSTDGFGHFCSLEVDEFFYDSGEINPDSHAWTSYY